MKYLLKASILQSFQLLHLYATYRPNQLRGVLGFWGFLFLRLVLAFGGHLKLNKLIIVF